MHGIRKTALFLNGLPEEARVTLLQKLEPLTASKVRVEMTRLKDIPQENIHRTVAEFLDTIQSQEFTKKVPAQQPDVYAAPQKSRHVETQEYSPPVTETYQPIPQTMESFSQGIDFLTLETSRSRASQEQEENTRFSFLRNLKPEEIRELLLFETPRIVAVLLTQLTPRQSGQILEQLTPEAQKEVVAILFDLEEVDPEILDEIETALKERTESIFGKSRKNIGHAAAKRILQAIDPAMRRHILNETADETPAAAQPKQTRRPFAFEDLQNLPNRGLREIFDSVDAITALVSLVGAPQQLIDRALGQRTPAEEQRLLRQYQSLAPIKQIDVDAARQRILEKFQSHS